MKILKFLVVVAFLLTGCDKPSPTSEKVDSAPAAVKVDGKTTLNYWTEVNRLVTWGANSSEAERMANFERAEKLPTAGVDPEVVDVWKRMLAFMRLYIERTKRLLTTAEEEHLAKEKDGKIKRDMQRLPKLLTARYGMEFPGDNPFGKKPAPTTETAADK